MVAHGEVHHILRAVPRPQLEDAHGNISVACSLMTVGVAGLEKLLQQEVDPKRLALLRERHTEYSSRLHELRHTQELPSREHLPLFFPDKKLPCRSFVAGLECENPKCKLAHHETSLTQIIRILDGAKLSLAVAVYSIGLELLTDALTTAAARGVAVRVLTDNQQAKASGSNVQRLISAGIPVRTNSGERLHMHHKFAVVDRAVLLSGSFNWTVPSTRSRTVASPLVC